MSAELLNLHGLARETRLPLSWLEAEARAGRLPCLRVGRRLRFNLEAVKKSLLERAASNASAEVKLELQRGASGG